MSAALDAIKSANPTERLAAITRLVTEARGHDRTAASSVLAALEPMVAQAAAAGLLGERSSWRATGLGRWLTAKALEIGGDTDAAIAAWTNVINADSVAPEAYLSRSRLRARGGDVTGAYADIRRAAEFSQDYRLLAQVASHYEKLRKMAPAPASRTLRIAVLSSTTTDLFAPILGLTCFRDGIVSDLYVAPFGSFRQEILDPTSGLYRFRPDIVLIATHWRDAVSRAHESSPERQVDVVVEEFRGLWDTLLNGHACRILQHNFDAPAVDSHGHLSGALPSGRRRVLEAINRRLVEVAPSAVTIVDFDGIAARFGKARWSDAANWHVAKQHPAIEALPVLAHTIAALIRASVGLSRKVLVLDLDNTMWAGVVGEDGVNGIRVGPPTPGGEAHAALQAYALELKERGVLLAVCSKNNIEDAKAPFEQHDGMVLKLDDFVLFRANWTDKASNLKEMAAALNLGVDSFVFLDDNPVERALVRQELPEVAVPEPGADPATLAECLDAGRYFEALSVSAEDRQRHESYRENAQREELRASAGTVEGFLIGLDMRAEVGSFNEAVLGRVVQLLGKTNQFNVTTRRHGDELIRRMMTSGAYWTRYFKLRDRFGDNGMIGLMIVNTGGENWEIDSWLMSCRVMGRQVEDLMFDTLVNAASAAGARWIEGSYIPTKKNGMVADLYARMGFQEVSRTPGEVRYRLDVNHSRTRRAQFIHVVNADESSGHSG